MGVRTFFVDLAFPVVCAGCGDHPGRLICPSCLVNITRPRGPSCLRCGRPTQYPVEACNHCREHLRHLDGTVALGLYREPLRELIHEFKYRGTAVLARPLGAMLAAEVAPRLASGDFLVTHVPAHPRRRRERGYDQAELLARQVSSCLGLPFAPLLQRVRHTRPQVELGLEERLGNVRDAFRPSPLCRSDAARERSVLLVDDVLTTGATLGEGAKVLKGRGVSAVIACVLARDLPEGQG